MLPTRCRKGCAFDSPKSLWPIPSRSASPHKHIVITLATAKLDPSPATGGKPPEPQPAMTVARILGFKTQQRFDFTALVEKVSEASRKAGPGRKVCDIFLVDNSESDDKTLDLKVSIFYPEDHPADAHAALSQKAKSSIALTFFCLQAEKDAKGYSVESSMEFSGRTHRETEPRP